MFSGGITGSLPRQVPRLPQCSYGLELDPSNIMWTVKFIKKSSKSIFQLVPFNWKQISVTQSFTGNGISGKCFH